MALEISCEKEPIKTFLAFVHIELNLAVSDGIGEIASMIHQIIIVFVVANQTEVFFLITADTSLIAFTRH